MEYVNESPYKDKYTECKSYGISRKIKNIFQEINRMKINNNGMSEMRWPSSGFHDIDDHGIECSGTTRSQFYYGVGLLICKIIAGSVIHFSPIPERLLLSQINAKHTNDCPSSGCPNNRPKLGINACDVFGNQIYLFPNNGRSE